MSDLVVWCKAPTFQMAGEEARDLAMTYDESIALGRVGNEWAVLVSQTLFDSITREIKKQADEDAREEANDDPAEECGDEADDSGEEARREIEQEMSSDVEDWGRSDESGWYYED